MKKTRNGGFTLIELLVVIAIIGILATIVTVSFRGIQADARDTRRQTEIRDIRFAMESYYQKNSKFPESAVATGGVVPDAVKTDLVESFPDFPKDPQDTTGSCGGSYCWVGNMAEGVDGQSYCLYAILEKEGTAPATEKVYFVADEGSAREVQSATAPVCSL